MSEMKAFRIIQGDTGGYGAPSYKCDADGSRIEEWSDACEVYDKSEADKVIAELKAEIESLKASHYAESVDAGMRERRLRRALWLARAERANEKQQLFYFSISYDKLCIDGFYNPSSGRRELSPKQWIKVFNKVESKCRAMAERYGEGK